MLQTPSTATAGGPATVPSGAPYGLLRRALRLAGGAALALFLAACVTINVYFPAAAAERVADEIVREVYGLGSGGEADAPPEEDTPAAGALPDGTGASLRPAGDGPLLSRLAMGLEGLLVRRAAAQPDLNVSTPAIERLKGAMQARHRQLLPYYDNGAIGMAANGLLVLRDPQAVPLNQRQAVTDLVAAENRDRNGLYREIAVANGHPEWESRIRATFQSRWVANAPGGWWFQDAGGNWRRS